ncbi:MAG: DUF1501 domain-containing protein [Phycisphaerae bacterium]|nr:DUF1501 domain-containing protein [Phycisphaerae bacterium]
MRFQQAHRMAIVRSMHHRAPSHRSAAYWNLTGHEPPKLDGNWPATRKDWPCLGSMVGRARAPEAGSMPGAVCLPYTMADGGRANGQDGGFMGLADDPVVLRPASGTPYDGVSPTAGAVDLALPDGLSKQRLVSRRGLLRDLEGGAADGGAVKFREMGLNMLLDPAVRRAFDLESEPPALRDRYGRHICGQSVLLARKLSEAGVPLVTVYCAAGDLNGSKGAHWDTHANNFNRLKGQMLPPLDRASGALLDDLAGRGLLEQTLVVWLTEFGRTPKINGNRGRDHFPDCYTVALAGGGIAGGQLYGRSDAIGAKPAELGASPADLHATVFHALGIDPDFTVYDRENRPYPACDGQALPLFG